MTTPTAMTEWGKDHWSLLAYVECRVVDNHGYLDSRHLRGDGDAYPTRLRGYSQDNARQVVGHSDYDCLNDLIAAGLIAPAEGTTPGGRVRFADLEARAEKFGTASARHGTRRYQLTTAGMAIAGALRAHKASGGNFAGFQP